MMENTIMLEVNKGEKIKCSIVGVLRTTGRRNYIQIPPMISQTYQLKIGDVVKLELLEVFRKKPEEET